MSRTKVAWICAPALLKKRSTNYRISARPKSFPQNISPSLNMGIMVPVKVLELNCFLPQQLPNPLLVKFFHLRIVRLPKPVDRLVIHREPRTDSLSQRERAG